MILSPFFLIIPFAKWGVALQRKSAIYEEGKIIYEERKKFFEEGKNIFGEQISRYEEGISRAEERIIEHHFWRIATLFFALLCFSHTSFN
ncbi:MAG: hypothetical protein J6T94_07225 [Bacteroidaceae bacterium]|nr:hypothetical protein [Bacteroidaceae bacterium]MBP5323089.1 hypothetical protein [Bacteroidaceae bacterium]